MPAYKKQGGVWNPAGRIYVHQNGVFTPSDQVYVKSGGIWQLTHEYDVTPPNVPVMTLSVEEDTYWDSGEKRVGRYIKVGVSNLNPDPGLRRIRVLTTYNGKMPTTPFGGNYTQAPAASFPNEPWSDWSFNGFNGYNRTGAEITYKRWPRAAGDTGYLGAGTYYFAAFAEDNFGNWSGGNFQTIVVPRLDANSLGSGGGGTGGGGGGSRSKEKNFQVTATGVWSGGSFSYGRPTQAKGPIRRGLFFYGGVLKDEIGKSGKAKIRKAQIRIERRDDGGKPNANVYLAYHGFGLASSFREDASWSKPVRLGTIGKGQTKWFKIPAAWYDAIEKDQVKGFLLNHKDPNKNDAQANDFSVMNSASDSVRTGELHVVWTE